MQLNEILAVRLSALMDSRPDLDTQVKLHQRTGLAQATIQRVLSRKVHTGLDVLQSLAGAFGVSPVSLLEPIKDGQDLQQVPPSIEEIALLQHWRKLDELEKHTVMGYLGLVGASKEQRANARRKTTLNDDLKTPDNMTAAHIRAIERPATTKPKGDSNSAPKTSGGASKKRSAS